MDVLQSFPRHLLDEPAAERISYFENFTTRHPHLDSVYDDLKDALREARPGSLVLIYGAAGVGKTTLLKRVLKHLLEEVLDELEEDRGRIPAVLIEAVAPESGNYNWLDYYERLLSSMGEPLINRKIAVREPRADSVGDKVTAGGSSKNGRALRLAVEGVLCHRKTGTLLLDEAQHLAIISSGRKVSDQLNTIKSLANMTETTHVLAGTYELMLFRNLSGQLSRRSIDLHFRRYHANIPEEREEFINVLYTFQQQLPLPETPDLVSNWDYFYERTIGCVGVLKCWLLRALIVSINGGKQSLTRQIIEKRALTVAQCEKLLTESIEGERELREGRGATAKLRERLGLTVKSVKAPKPSGGAPSQGGSPHAAPPKPRRRVGDRNAVRDPAGDDDKRSHK